MGVIGMNDVEYLRSLTPKIFLHELLTNTIIHKIFAALFSAITFLQVFNLYNIYLQNEWYGTFYIVSMQNFTIENFTLPLLYWLGLAVYLPFGDAGLFGISIIVFSIAFLYLIRLFWNYKFMIPFIFWIIFLRHESANWLLFYSRDMLIFMFACMFSYYFYKTWVEHDNKYWKMGIICLFALYTKTSAILFIILLISLYLYQNTKKLTIENSLAAIPLFRPEWVYSAWLTDLIKGIESFIYRLKVNDIVFLFPNSFFLISFMVFIYSRGFIPFVIIFLTVITGVVINNISTQFYDAETIWRYTFIMVPMNILLIAKHIQQSWERYKSKAVVA